eukprot:2084838-Lingulodinium_polyedra.AAC.1
MANAPLVMPYASGPRSAAGPRKPWVPPLVRVDFDLNVHDAPWPGRGEAVAAPAPAAGPAASTPAASSSWDVERDTDDEGSSSSDD